LDITKFNKILVPLDGSELAERVLLPAVRWAEAVQAGLVLLAVVTPQLRSSHPDKVENVVQTRSYEAGLYLKGLHKRLMPTLIEVETAVLSGPAAHTILTYAQENGVDLILMTTHGRSGLTRWSLGQVAHKVLRRAPCPVVILRSAQTLIPENIRRILAPLDGSPLAEAVLQQTVAAAVGLRAEMLLLQVVEPGSVWSFGHEETAVPDPDVQAAQLYLAAVQQKIQALPLKGIQTSCHVTVGPVAESIIDFADENEIDLIVLSSVGASGIQSWMFGSVAERVMQGAHCATMLVRPEPVE